MRRYVKPVLLLLIIWLVTRSLFFVYASRIGFDEGNYLYEAYKLVNASPELYSQGPVIYYLLFPFLSLSSSLVVAKLPILLTDLIFMLVIYCLLRKHNESLAFWSSLLYTLSPMGAFLSHHVNVDVPALLFTFLSIYYFVCYHSFKENTYLILSGIFILLSGLTKETDFFIFIILILYLVLWNLRIEPVKWYSVVKLFFLIFFTYILKAIILSQLWNKNPSRMLVLLFFLFKTGGFLNMGLLYFAIVFFLFVNPVTAVLGYHRVLSLIRSLLRKKRKKVSLTFLFRLKFISAITILFLIAFFTIYGADEARYVYYITPFLAIFAAESIRKLSSKWKAVCVIVGLILQIGLVIEYEKDTSGIEELGKYLQKLPTDVFYTNEPMRPSEHFVPFIFMFKTSKEVRYVPNDEIPKLALHSPIYLLSYNRSGLPTVDEAFQTHNITYQRIDFFVSNYNRSVYAAGPRAILPVPQQTQFYTIFTQRFRTPLEDKILRLLMQLKRDFCTRSDNSLRWIKSNACNWGKS